jgi:hypothetical protein
VIAIKGSNISTKGCVVCVVCVCMCVCIWKSIQIDNVQERQKDLNMYVYYRCLLTEDGVKIRHNV